MSAPQSAFSLAMRCPLLTLRAGEAAMSSGTTKRPRKLHAQTLERARVVSLLVRSICDLVSGADVHHSRTRRDCEEPGEPSCRPACLLCDGRL
eukprot:3869920-Rhodomonas_salina.1